MRSKVKNYISFPLALSTTAYSTRSVTEQCLLSNNSLLVYSRTCLKNRNKINMIGKEDKPYAVCSGSLEFNSNPRIKYIASITQITPITV